VADSLISSTSAPEFKNEFVQSLDTTEAAAAKKQAHRAALKFAIEDAEAVPRTNTPTINPQEIGEVVYTQKNHPSAKCAPPAFATY
jgi:hypothetical protein